MYQKIEKATSLYCDKFKLVVLRFISVLLILCFLISTNVFANDNDNLKLSALSAIVISADNGQIIYAKDESTPRPMASTTKIMTALLTLEEAERNNKEVTITDKMVPVEGSSMYLKPGEVLSLENLAIGMLTVSGNDAAHSAAIAIAGSLDAFCVLMNDKAKQIGMNDTFFTTPSGLDEGGHHSTAHDMAILASYAMENKMFYDIVSQKKIQAKFIEPAQSRTLKNTNKMLSLYDGCVGVKTGYTKKAKRCLVTCAEREGTRLIAVTLHADDDWMDHQILLDYGFSKVETIFLDDDEHFTVDLVGGYENTVNVSVKEPSKITLEKNSSHNLKKIIELPRFIYAPIREGEKVGRIIYTLDDKLIAINDLYCTSQEAYYGKKKNIFRRFIDFIKGV